MNETITDFLFAAAETGKPVEVLRTGVFIDRNGREITVTEEDIDAFIANFEAGEAGQDVPIDIDHERAAAAGWIKRVWREGKKLLAEPDWNSLGKNLVGDKVYKYLSATIDMGKKVLKTVSLVNMPAVKGLKPVELGEGVYSLADGRPGSIKIGQFITAHLHKLFTNIADNLMLSGFLSTDERKGFSGAIGDSLGVLDEGLGEAKERLIQTNDYESFKPPRQAVMDFSHQFSEENTMNEQVDLEKLKAEVRAELEAELAQQQQTEAELREQVKAELEAELKAKYERRQSLAEFAEEICNGEGGLSTPPDELVELLEALPDEQLEAAKKVLRAKIVSFGETGSSRDGANGKAQLPDYAVKDVKAGTITVTELFEAKAVGGKMEDYNLAEFSKEQIG